jgi:hypothetical protein
MLGAANRPHPRTCRGGLHLFCLFYQVEIRRGGPSTVVKRTLRTSHICRKTPRELRQRDALRKISATPNRMVGLRRTLCAAGVDRISMRFNGHLAAWERLC